MKLTLPLLMMLLFSQALSQDYKLHQRYPGYFINAKGDTIHGYILILNKLINQVGAEYSNDAKGEKIIIHLLPDEVMGFKVKDRVYTSCSYGEADPKSEHFLLTIAEGELKLYQYFRLAKDMYVPAANGQRPATGDDEQYLQSEYVIINKKNNQFSISGETQLIKNTDKIFSANAELAQKIKDKEKGFRYNDLPEIVTKYNEEIGK